ncbi:non-ribosomal peptide synthetase, partial [Pelomyxa schiedti]
MATNSRLSARPRRIAVCAGFNEDPDISTWLFDKVALWCGHNLNIGSSPLTSTSAEALPCPTRPKWKVLVDGWVRGVCVSFSTKAREGGLIDRQCAALDVTAAVFSHVNGASVDYYNVYSWIVDRSTRPPNAVLGAPVILVPLIYLYSCACFVAAALDPATQRRDPTAPAGGAALQRPHGGGAEAASLWDAAAEDSDPNGDERLRRFARSFDVALGYSAGVSPASAISKSDSMDKMGTFCVDLMMVGASNCLFTLESHNKQWGKELMGKSWMSLVKGPLNVVEKRLTEVNAEFPETPLFASIILAPNQTVVCGHPDSLEKLRTLAPQQFKLLPVKEAYHTSFYQTEVQNKFISSYPKERYAFAAPLSDGCTTISSSTNTDSSQLDAASFVIRLQRDSIENKIDWPETVKAGISCNGGCDSVEIFDFGPPGIGILTHNLCGALFKKKSTFINCVTAHDPPKEPTALPISTTVTPTPKLDTSTLTLVEKKVHELWCEALPAPPSSIDEDFFEAGGDSIAALKMLTAANNLGWNLSIVELFSSRTIRSVAALVAASTSSSSVTSTKARYPPITASTKVLGKRKAPLSLSQHRLFFLDQLQPNSVQYSVFGGIHLIGPLNCSAVQKAANSIAVRHESIRTRFMTDDGSAESYQLVLPPDDPGSAIKFSEELYKGIPTAEEKAKWLSEQFRKEVNIPFDLQRGPLVRLTLFRLTEEETVLFIIAHHIITDGWSMVLFLKELSCNYNQVLAESKPNTAQMETAPLSPLPFQYADFAIWQREVLLGPSNDLKEKQMSFWKKELEGVNSVCELPLDRPRTDNRTYSAGFHIHIIPPSLFSALSSLGRTISTSTPFMTVLTVFNLLLHLHSPRWFQDQVHTTTGDMVVGIPTANRHYTGVGSLFGFFVNTLPIRTIIEESKSFKETLDYVKGKILSVQEAQDVPLDWIVDATHIETRMSMHTLVQVLFVMDDWKFLDKKNFTMEGIRDLKPLYNIPPAMSKVDLTLNAVPQPDGSLELQFEFAKDILDESTVVRLANNMDTLIRSVLSTPNKPISQLKVINDADIKRFATWNSTEKYFKTSEEATRKAVHFMFEESVSKHASFPALQLGNVTVRYDELNNRTNQLAHFLKSTHPEAVGPGKFIPIIAERSIEQFVALYGVLKAGAAYVPIDPESPPDRISAILEDISPVSFVILSHKSLRSQLPPEQPFQVISILEDGDLWKSFPTTNPPHNIETGSEEVYAIFTSGSTGKPKAAVNHHLGVANFVMWLRDEYKLTTEDRILHKTPFFFDGCALEVFASLASGSCVVIAPPGAHQDPEQLLQLVRDNRVTVLLLVPTMLREFISTVALQGGSASPRPIKSLRTIISAGESLHWELVHKVFDCLGKDITFHNHYGPSEASCCTTFLDCSESLKNHPEME